jgi:hypothetical protein
VRSKLIVLMEHRAEVEAWRDTLDLTLKLSLNHPNSMLRAWKKATTVRSPSERKRGNARNAARIKELLAANTDLRAYVAELESARPSSLHAHGQCSFCGKLRDEVELLVEGEDVAICDGCVEWAARMVEAHRQGKVPALPTAKVVEPA